MSKNDERKEALFSKKTIEMENDEPKYLDIKLYRVEDIEVEGDINDFAKWILEEE